MICLSCNKILNDFEATRKYPWGEFIDLCSRCYALAGLVHSRDREDLLSEDEYTSEDLSEYKSD